MYCKAVATFSLTTVCTLTSVSLTPKQLELVQSSWEKVEPIADTAADIFYTKMFETEPSFRALFPEDMSKQKRALMKMLGMAVKGITDLDELVPKVQDLGRRHAKVWNEPFMNLCHD